VKWYFHSLRKYAVFAGRAHRREYWTFELWNLIIPAALVFVDIKIGESSHPDRAVLTGVYLLVTAIPSLAGSVRRLHDTNHSGWAVFLGMIPLVGQFVLLRFLVKDSDPGSNRFGPNPKMETKPVPNAEMGYLAPPLPRERD